jgi:hypothetical protein
MEQQDTPTPSNSEVLTRAALDGEHDAFRRAELVGVTGRDSTASSSPTPTTSSRAAREQRTTFGTPSRSLDRPLRPSTRWRTLCAATTAKPWGAGGGQGDRGR